MRILVLAINVSPRDKRDTITYNFIRKELHWLADNGVDVLYLSELREHKTIAGVQYLAKDQLLEHSAFWRRLFNLVFMIHYAAFFLPMALCCFAKAMRVCGVERACDKILQKHTVDCIHVHFFEPRGESAVLSARRHRIPVVATLRGSELRAMPQFAYGARLDRFYDIALHRALPRIHFFTAPSRFLCDLLHESFGVSGLRIRYLPNGVEPIAVQKSAPEYSAPASFIAIGNMAPIKNFQVIFGALEQLSRSFCFEAHFVGSGPVIDTYRMHLERFPHVHVHQEMDKKSLYALISRCDFLVHPSYSEGMPNVVLEALSMGVPCVVSNIPVHLEIIREEETGYVFDVHNYTECIRKMSIALGNREKLWEMRDACIQTAARFSLDIKMNGLVEVFDALRKTPYKSLADPRVIIAGARSQYTYGTT